MPSSERSRDSVDGPSLEQQDWSDLASLAEPDSRPDNGDIQYPAAGATNPGRLSGENDDNAYQQSDEALPDDDEEEAIAEANRADGLPGNGRRQG